MNGLTGLSIVAILALGVLVTNTIENIKQNEEKIAIAKKARQVATVVKHSNIISDATDNFVGSAGYIPDVNPNALDIDTMSVSDKMLLTRLNNAMKIAVLRENILHPTCADLAATGQISLEGCEKISRELNHYVNIRDGSIVAGKIDSTNLSSANSKRKIYSFLNSFKVMVGQRKVEMSTDKNVQSSVTNEAIAAGNNNAVSDNTALLKIPVITSKVKQTINEIDKIPREVIRRMMVENFLAKQVNNSNENNDADNNLKNSNNINSEVPFVRETVIINRGDRNLFIMKEFFDNFMYKNRDAYHQSQNKNSYTTNNVLNNGGVNMDAASMQKEGDNSINLNNLKPVNMKNQSENNTDNSDNSVKNYERSFLGEMGTSDRMSNSGINNKNTGNIQR